MNTITPEQILAQMRRLSSTAQGADLKNTALGPTNAAPNAEFSSALNKALETINQHQLAAADAATRIESGDGGVSLVKAVIASQKASVAFDAAVQVRNRVVSAYQDIMNMPI